MLQRALSAHERLERIVHKSEKDVVTEVDHLSEELIISAIRAAYPTDGIIADFVGLGAAIHLVAALTFLSGIVVMYAMAERMAVPAAASAPDEPVPPKPG